MLKRFLTALFFIFLSLTIWAQAPVSLSNIDFSDAEISQSGPKSFYVRNVVLPDQIVSLSIVLNSDGYWVIDKIYPESDNYIPGALILDFATVEVSGEDTLKIDWVIYKGAILSGELGLSGDELTLSDGFKTRGKLASADEYPRNLSDLIGSAAPDSSASALADLKKEYEETITALTAEYENAVTERDAYKAIADASTGQIAKLKDEKATLQTLKDNLDKENKSLQTMIDTLKSTNDTTLSASQSVVQSYIDKLDALNEEISSLRANITSLESQLSSEMLSAAAKVSEALSEDFDWAVVQLDSSISSSLEKGVDKAASSIASSVSSDLDERLDSAESSIKAMISGINLAGSAGITAPAENQTARIEELEALIADLKEKNEALSLKMKQLDEEIRESFVKSGFIAMLRPTLTKTLVSSFEPSDAQLGFWRVGNDSASQLEKSMLFGKLLLPVTQDDKPVLYSFKARSTDPANEWVGLGLHVFVENVEKRGYGLGDSLLVWLTRDQEVYKNNYTYLQLYRSDDDVNMDRVMDAVIQEPITEFLQIEVLYQPVHQYITISINGQEKIRYKTWFGIDSGIQVALRSLGTAEFKDLRVTTTP